MKTALQKAGNLWGKPCGKKILLYIKHIKFILLDIYSKIPHEDF